VIRDYLELSKSRIVVMVLMTTAAGFFYAAPHAAIALLAKTLLGTALVAAGTNALNEYAERDLDRSMRRTQKRPLPAGRITPRAALLFASAIAILGTVYLGIAVNWLTAALGAFTLVTYIFIYTPLKRVSTICTLVGAIPGAIPPLMGWTAATGTIGTGGLIAFAIVFLWQLPHFMAISWIYREDYGRAGFRMLSVSDSDGSAVARQAVYYSIALLIVSLFVRPQFAAVAAAALLLVMSFVFLHELAAMKGKVTVYDFIFTNCAGTCPMMTSTLRRVTKRIDAGAPVQFVSISVDPRRDTPAQLHNYAAHYRNDPRWLFLTGDEKTIVDLSINGFKLAASNDGSTNESVLHSSKFAIADKHGVIRDYYGATADDAVDHVANTVHDLLRED